MNSNDLISVNYDKEITEQEGKDFINNMNEINLSFKEEEDKTVLNKAMALCPKCGGFPFIGLEMSEQPEIKIDCDCFESQMYLLSEYVKEMNHSNIIFKTMCNKHSKDFNYYCVSCIEHLCEQCTKTNEHKLHMISKLIEIDIKQKKEEVKKIIQLYDNHLTEFKKKVISQLDQEKDRMTIQNLYESCIKRNEDILMLIELMFNSYLYNTTNFYVQSNLERFTDFEIIKFKSEIEKPINENLMNSIIDYLNNSNFIKGDTKIDFIITNQRKNYVDIKKFKLIHTIQKGKGDIIDIITLKDGRVVIYNQSCLFIINIETLECNIVISFTTQITSLIVLADNHIVTSNLSNEICIYKLSEKFMIEKIINHNKGLTQVFEINKNKIAACDIDGDIHIIDINTEEKHTLNKTFSNDVIIFTMINDNYLVTKEECDINVWDINNYSKVFSVTLDYWKINYVKFDYEHNLLLAGNYCKYSKIDFTTKEIVDKVDISKEIISFGAVPNKMITLRDGKELYCYSGKNGRIVLKDKTCSKQKNMSIKTFTCINVDTIGVISENELNIWKY